MKKRYLKPRMTAMRIGLYDDIADEELIFGQGSNGTKKVDGDEEIDPDVKEDVSDKWFDHDNNLWDEDW